MHLLTLTKIYHLPSTLVHFKSDDDDDDDDKIISYYNTYICTSHFHQNTEYRGKNTTEKYTQPLLIIAWKKLACVAEKNPHFLLVSVLRVCRFLSIQVNLRWTIAGKM